MSLNYTFAVDLALRHRPTHGRLLDYGCGTASLAALAQARGYDAYGVDTFDFQYAGGGLNSAARNIGERAIAIAPGRALPFVDGYFDIIVCNQVMEHIAQLEPVRDELARITRPGGVLICLMPTSEVLWETHLKMPLVHYLSTGSRAQRFAVQACSSIGLGDRHVTPHRERVERALSNLQGQIFHRPADAYIRLFDTHFQLTEEAEPAWLRHRLASHPRLRGAAQPLQAPRLDGALRKLTRRLAGAVLVFTRRET